MQRQKALVNLPENRALRQGLLAQLPGLQAHGIRREIARGKTAGVLGGKGRIGAAHQRLQQRHRGKQRETGRYRVQRIWVARRIHRVHSLRAQRQPGLLHRLRRIGRCADAKDALTKGLRGNLAGVHLAQLHLSQRQLHRVVRAALLARLIKILEKTHRRNLLGARLSMQLLVHRELLRVALNHIRHRVGAFPVQLLTALSTLGRERVVLAARRLHVAGANQLKGQEEERKLPRPGEENNGDHGA